MERVAVCEHIHDPRADEGLVHLSEDNCGESIAHDCLQAHGQELSKLSCNSNTVTTNTRT
eukprot:2090610-Amphidinium_carterae.1